QVRVMAGRSLFLVGVAVLLFIGYEVAVSGLFEARSQRSLLARFQADAQSPADSTGAFLSGDPMALLDIPSLHVTQVVVEGATPSLLREGPGPLQGTPLPGQPGNVVLAGRRVTYGGPFRRLSELRPGDRIVLTTAQGRFEYVVASVRVVRPGQRDVL